MPRTPRIGTKAGATSSRKSISRREQTRLRPPNTAKLNWKVGNRKRWRKQSLQTFLRQTVRDERVASSASSSCPTLLEALNVIEAITRRDPATGILSALEAVTLKNL